MRAVLRSALVTLVGLAALTGCSEPREAGFRLGNRHAELLAANKIELKDLDKELRDAEVGYAEGEAREAFHEGYQKGIDPATKNLAELYVRTAAEDLEEATKSMQKDLDGFVKGVIEDVDKRVDDLGSDENKEDMKTVGRHLGRVIKGLGKALKAAVDGFSEEVKK